MMVFVGRSRFANAREDADMFEFVLGVARRDISNEY